MARFIALIFTWWNIFVRQVSPTTHREGHVSRPVLLHGVARRVTHAGTTTLRVTSLHAKATAIMAALNAVTKRLKELALTATTQLAGSTTGNRWDTIISPSSIHSSPRERGHMRSYEPESKPTERLQPPVATGG